MAISIKTKDVQQVLDAFDISLEMQALMATKGVIVSLTTSSIYVKAGPISHTVQVKPGAVSMAVVGKLGPASKEAISYKLQKAIKLCLETPVVVGIDPAEFSEEVVSAVLKNGGIPTFPEPADPAPDPDPLQGPVGKNAKPIPLIAADYQYTPVKGTSVGSIYLLIAATADLKLAARWNGSILSFRAEGAVKKWKAQLMNGGFNMDNLDSGYMSVHLEVSNKNLAAKALGAVLVGSEIPFTTPLPSFKELIGAGH